MDELPIYFSGVLAVLLLSSFVRVFTTLNILRFGMGLEGGGFGIVIFALSVALSLLVMDPVLKGAGGVQGLFAGQNIETKGALEEKFRPFLEKHTPVELRSRFSSIVKTAETSAAPDAKEPFSVLAAAFLVSELKEAFKLGFLFIVPFLVIDILVANSLALLGVQQISQAVVALPIKILLFFAVDGWTLVSSKLVGGYF